MLNFLKRKILARMAGGSGNLVNIFQGQMGDSPPMFGVTQYSFESEIWDQLSFYPSKSLGNAALKGEWEMPDPENVENELKNEEPVAKKIKMTADMKSDRNIEKSEEEIAAIKAGTFGNKST